MHDDDMSTEDTFTGVELAEMERDDELHQDALDDARETGVPSCCHTRGHHVNCPGF